MNFSMADFSEMELIDENGFADVISRNDNGNNIILPQQKLYYDRKNNRYYRVIEEAKIYSEMLQRPDGSFEQGKNMPIFIGKIV